MRPMSERAIRNIYNNIQQIWPDDPWYRHTTTRIRSLVGHFTRKYDFGHVVLNAGAGGTDAADLCDNDKIDFDLSEKRIAPCTKPVCGNIETLPFKDAAFSSVLCVGSVINYCKADRSIAEFSRTTAPGGYLAIEFETTEGLDLIGFDSFKRDVAIVTNLYDVHDSEINVKYSSPHIQSILKENGYAIREVTRFHHLSPLLYRLCGSRRISGVLSSLDCVARFMPILRTHAWNTFILAQKVA